MKIATAAVRITLFSCSANYYSAQYFYQVLQKIWMLTQIKQIAFFCIFISRVYNGIINVLSFFLNSNPGVATQSLIKKTQANISWGFEKVHLSFLKLNCSFPLAFTSLLVKTDTLELQNYHQIIRVSPKHPNCSAQHGLDWVYHISHTWPKGNPAEFEHEPGLTFPVDLTPFGCKMCVYHLWLQWASSWNTAKNTTRAFSLIISLNKIDFLKANWTISSFRKCLNFIESGIH